MYITHYEYISLFNYIKETELSEEIMEILEELILKSSATVFAGQYYFYIIGKDVKIFVEDFICEKTLEFVKNDNTEELTLIFLYYMSLTIADFEWLSDINDRIKSALPPNIIEQKKEFNEKNLAHRGKSDVNIFYKLEERFKYLNSKLFFLH